MSWPYEALSFCYDAQGLVSFQWTDPCIYTDISEEYVFLLPFEEICRIFRTVFPEKYAAYASDGREADFHITRIRLGYMRIMEPGNWMEGTLIPAWDFFGYWIYGDAADSENADSNLLTEPKIPEHYLSGGLSYSLLTVNACDGTVIDRSLGY